MEKWLDNVMQYLVTTDTFEDHVAIRPVDAVMTRLKDKDFQADLVDSVFFAPSVDFVVIIVVDRQADPCLISNFKRFPNLPAQ